MKISPRMFQDHMSAILDGREFTGQVILHMNQGDIVKYELRQTYHKSEMEKKVLIKNTNNEYRVNGPDKQGRTGHNNCNVWIEINYNKTHITYCLL